MSIRTVTDQLGANISFQYPPTRIISLVPSQTEFLSSINLHAEVVGITKFCVHPRQWFLEKPKIGGTKSFDIEAIRALEPDLIIGNKEENYREGIELLKEEFPVWMSDINNLEDAVEMMAQIGEITAKVSETKDITSTILTEFKNILKAETRSVLYLIWRKPWMCAGTNTFIDDILRRLGLRNSVLEYRYPELNEDAIRSIAPELVLLSSEPYPFSEKHISEIQQLLPHADIRLVDGEMFSWYGSRLRLAPAYFNSLRF